MKKTILIFLVMLFIPFSCVQSHGAEHIVTSGQVFGQVVKIAGYSGQMDELALFNGVIPPDYVILKDQIIKYVSDKDIRLAQKYVDEMLSILLPDDPERAAFLRFKNDLVARNFEYDDDKDQSKKMYASFVLICADAQEAR